MLEYVFFHRKPFDSFLSFLAERAVVAETAVDEDLYEVRVSEALDEALSDEIEDYYGEMMELNQELVDGEAAQSGGYHTAGVVVNLQDGKSVYAQVDPRLLAKVMEVLSPVELGDLVNAIVDAVEQRDGRTLCQRMRDDG